MFYVHLNVIGDHVLKCKPLFFMYMISGWKLLSLQNHVKNVHYIQSYSQLNLYMRKKLLKNHSSHHPSSHVFGSKLISPLSHSSRAYGYKCGGAWIWNILWSPQIHPSWSYNICIRIITCISYGPYDKP